MSLEIDLPDVVAEVRAAFDRYERALVTKITLHPLCTARTT